MGFGEGFTGEGRAALLSSASGFSCRWGWGEEGAAVPSAKRGAPGAGVSLGDGGWGGGLAVGAGTRFCG